MDPLECREHCSARCPEVQGIGIDTASNCSENTILYDVKSDMIIAYDIVDSESLNNNSNDLVELPDINQLRAEITVWLEGQIVLHLTLLLLLTIHWQALDIIGCEIGRYMAGIQRMERAVKKKQQISPPKKFYFAEQL